MVQATDNFNPTHKISEGTFADIYRGQRQGMPFVCKKLREASTSWFLAGGGGCMVRLDFNVAVFSHRRPAQAQDQLRNSCKQRNRFVKGKPSLWKILCLIVMTANPYMVLPVWQPCFKHSVCINSFCPHKNPVT